MNNGILGWPGTDPVIPPGVIVMWSGLISAIPAGWSLCDGTNGTPNLLDRFVRSVATATTDPGTTGGANSVSYTPQGSVSAPFFTGDAMAGHWHVLSGSTDSESSHTHAVLDPDVPDLRNIPGGVAADQATGEDHTGLTGPGSAHSHGVSGVTVSSESAGTPSGTVSAPTFTGAPDTINTLPAYYALAFIMKLV